MYVPEKLPASRGQTTVQRRTYSQVVARLHLRWLILGALLVAAFGLSPAQAACVAPSILLDGPSRLSVGDSVTVRGEFWTNECNDVISCSNGCGGSCVGGEPERPLRNITIVMTPVGGLGTPIVLAEDVDAALDLTFDRQVVIPPQASPGRYRLGAYAPGGDVFLGPRIRLE
jgi:hypothetical protein